MASRSERDTRGETTVVIDEESVLARWADWQARGKAEPVAAIAGEGEEPVMFVANEVLVDADDPDLARELVDMGAQIIEEPPLLPPPDEMETRELTGPFPMPFRLRFDRPPEIDHAAERLTELYRASDVRSGLVTVSSESAARVASLVARLSARGREITLNTLGTGADLPLKAAEEWASHPSGFSPFDWPAFNGKARIVHAWQLIESVKAVGSVKPVVWIAVLDGGFWLDAAGKPQVAMGQAASDFGPGVLQINLLAENVPAGDTNPNKCGDESCPWHGNGVASAAVAAVGNDAGAAGSGGTVGRPMFFRTNLSESQIFRCLNYCTAWGLDVLNMSFTLKRWELTFGTSSWNKAFQFALDNGVIMVAAAGNGDSDQVGQELPDYNVRPATRTPGVITVGALDGADNATGYSNYGSSVNIWAPGDNIPVAPDADNANGTVKSGTSMASPLVAGVAAMIRAVNPSLNSDKVRDLLIRTGWQGTGRVTRGLDAFAAVLDALGGALPADYGEPNNTPQTAALLLPTGPGGSLQPIFGGMATHTPGNRDFYKFALTSYSTVTIQLEWYNLLGSLTLVLESDDPEDRAVEELTLTRSHLTGNLTLQGLLPAGNYRAQIFGSAHTAYRLSVAHKFARIPKDMFEPNDSFESAAKLIFEPRKGFASPFLLRREYGPGIFDATLHSTHSIFMDGSVAVNPDYFELEVPASSVFRIPTVTISEADHPLNATLYDADRNVIQQWNNQRNFDVVPPPNSTCYLVITGSQVNRYTIATKLKVNRDAIPGPLQEELEIWPKWWGDPSPLEIHEREKYFGVVLGEDRGDGPAIVIEPPNEAVRVELLDRDLNVVAEAAQNGRGVQLDTAALEAGNYFLHVVRNAEAVEKAVKLKLKSPI